LCDGDLFLISTESIINSMVKANVRRRYSCHELFGFDVLLDDKLKPWVIEVNISPRSEDALSFLKLH